MSMTEREFKQSEQRMQVSRQHAYAVAARYNRRRARVIVSLNTGVEITFPPKLAQGLVDADPGDLAKIEITPSGLGLHWPDLDTDLYIPGLLAGAFSSKQWMAAQLGAAGGSVRSKAKAQAAHANGRLGGRPRKHSSER